jgi:BASS family bile acid:Na+ symporter
MGLTLRPEDFKIVLERPKLVLIGLFSQYAVMPLLGLIFGVFFFKNLPPDFTAGQVLTGSCPTGVVSNVYNFLAGANVALSISLSAVNTFVSPILTPILTAVLVSKIVHVDVLKLFLDMIQVTLIPVVVGIAVNYYFGEKLQRIKPLLPVYSTFAVVLIVGFVVSAGHKKILSLPLSSVLFLVLSSLFHLLFGFWFGYVIPRLLRVAKRERITISIETAMQNSGLATVLAISQWGALSALPAITYSVVQNLVGPFVCQLFRKMLRG